MATETFDTPGVFDWTPPAGITSVRATVINGGGSYPEWGSQGGACVTADFTVVPEVLISGAITVADALGADSANYNGYPGEFFNGTTGQLRVFGGFCSNSANDGPAVPGDPADAFYTLVGGNLVSAFVGGFGSLAGGGGSSAGTESNGNNASGVIGGFAPVGGGAGGNLDGPNGTAPGGGAGTNGVGASGRVILVYPVPTAAASSGNPGLRTGLSGIRSQLGGL